SLPAIEWSKTSQKGPIMQSVNTPKKQPNQTFKEQISSSWKDASDALRNTPQAFKLVWQASKRHTLINFSLIPLIAVLPAAQSWVGKMIVDRILQAIDINADVQRSEERRVGKCS